MAASDLLLEVPSSLRWIKEGWLPVGLGLEPLWYTEIRAWERQIL